MFVKQMFAKRLKELRELKGLNQRELAAKIDVSNGSISYYEKCQRLPDIETAYKLSEFFEVPSDYLLGLSDVSLPDPDLNSACKYTGLSESAVLQIQEDIVRCELIDDSEKLESPSLLLLLHDNLITKEEHDKMQKLLDDIENKIKNQDLYNAIICSETILEIVYAAHKNLIQKAEYDILTDYLKNNSEINEILQKVSNYNVDELSTTPPLTSDEYKIYYNAEFAKNSCKENLEFSKWKLESQIKEAVNTILLQVWAITFNNKTK